MKRTKSIFAFIAIALIMSSPCYAQWAITYGGNSGIAGASSIQQTQDGGYIVAGETSSFGVSNNESCVGCHGDQLPPYDPEIPCSRPTITYMDPNTGAYGAIVEITGSNFGHEKNPDRYVALYTNPGLVFVGKPPVLSWTYTMIEFKIPPYDPFVPGNYYVYVFTDCDQCSPPCAQNWSNKKPFTITEMPAQPPITPDAGVWGAYITLNGDGFVAGDDLATWRDWPVGTGNDRIYSLVTMTSSEAQYMCRSYQLFTDDQIQFRFKKLVIDTNDNFIRDGAETGIAPGDAHLGEYAVRVVSLYYEDRNADNVYSPGTNYVGITPDDPGFDAANDWVYQMTQSDAVSWWLVNGPWIYYLNPNKVWGYVDTRVKLIGANFGTTQGNSKVFYGSYELQGFPAGGGVNQTDYFSWSNTMIRVELPGNYCDPPAGVKRYYKRVYIRMYADWNNDGTQGVNEYADGNKPTLIIRDICY